MRIILLTIILAASNFGFSQETEKLTKKSLKFELAEFLVKKNQIKSSDKQISFRGIHKNQIDEILKSGIYVFNNGSSHNLSFFVIVDGNSFIILDISTLQGLKNSIARTLEFANKQNYCTEITQDYISRLINVHFTVNRNPRRRLNKNCEFELKPTISSFDKKSLEIKLAEFLIEKKELKDIDEYFKNPEDLFISDMSIYYGIEKEKNINCGIYTFAYLELDNPIFYYVILNEDWIEIFDIENFESLSGGINKILDFAENHKYCHLKTGQIIEQLIRIKYSESCFGNPTFELP